MSSRLGQTLAGLLNASFGNAVEIIVGVAALLRGAFLAAISSLPHYSPGFRRTAHCADFCECASILHVSDIKFKMPTQMLGSILSNILLVLGCSFLAGWH